MTGGSGAPGEGEIVGRNGRILELRYNDVSADVEYTVVGLTML